MSSQMHCPISGETPHEERVNYLTHLLGLFLSIIGSSFLITLVARNSGTSQLIACIVYSLCLISLYAASTYYHGCNRLTHKSILRIVDHSCIFLLIAGSYTPFVLGPLEMHGGWTLLYVEWTIAVLGISLKIFAVNRFKIFSLIAYLAMGWLIVLNMSAVIATLSATVLMLISLGGLSYTFGTIFFVWESFPYNHMIWHLFVLGGSAFHYFAILLISI